MTSLSGRKAFLAVWIGQLISVVGTRLSTFALGVWVLQQGHTTTEYALIFVFMAVPALLLAPFAGALVDRWDRRYVMMASDIACAGTVLSLGVLLTLQRMELWHIYVAAAVQALASAFQMPAYMASIPLLVPKEQLPRANGLVQTAFATAMILGPALAGVLVSTIALRGVLFVDFVSYSAAVVALMFVRIPHPVEDRRPRLSPSPDDDDRRGRLSSTLWQEAAEGWRFVRDRAGLLGLLVMFGFSNFVFGIASILITPLVLSFSNASGLGMQMAVGGAGLFAGGLAMSAWGGPKRRIHGVLAFTIIAGLFLAAHGLAANIWFISIAGFFFFLGLPVINASQDSIWQTKVPAALQGRCFAIQRVLSEAAMPVGYCLAGPLADHAFGGGGRGIALIFIISGFTMALAGASAYAVRAVRNVEIDLDDHLDAPATTPMSIPDAVLYGGVE
jgi:MFS family permease